MWVIENLIRMKRIFTLLCAAMLAGQAWADDFTIGKLYYTVTDETNHYVSVSRASNYDTPSGDLVIPESVTDPESNVKYTVTAIANYAFHSCADITSVTIPGTVTTIGMSAFYNCSGLTTVSIPSSITEIKFDDAFAGCISLASINVAEGNANYASEDGVLFNNDKTRLLYYPACKTGSTYSIPGTVTTINSSAFENCGNLTSITIPNSVKTIYSSAFRNCSNLTSITIPESVFTLGNYAFYGCVSLTEINVASGNRNYSSEDGVLFDDDKTELMCYPASKASSAYTVPESVTSIDDAAFYGCSNLKSVVISNTVTSLGDGIFQNCASLESATLPNSITYIPAGTFGGCTNLTSIEIPSTVTIIGNSAFSESGLTEIVIPSSVTEISSFAFQDGNGLTTITIPASVEKIGSYAFKGCKNLTINCCASSIPGGWNAYWNYDNRPYNLGSCGGEQTWTVTVSANNSSYGSVSGGGTYANGSTVTITATPAEGYSFVKWSNGLTTATANITVTSDTTLTAEFAKIGEVSPLQYEITSSNTVQVVHSEDYKNLTEIVIPETVVIDGKTYTVTSIGEKTFKDCYKLTSVTIPNTVTSIGGNAFWFCTNLTSIAIPKSVTSIGFRAFLYCVSLSNISVESGNKKYASEDGVLFDCNKTTLVCYPAGKTGSYTIPESVISIGENAFCECSKLTSITIPNSVKNIEDWAFYRCSGLASITIPNSVERIEHGAFEDCSGLESITIPESVTTIGGCVFENCDGLTSITIPESITSIPYGTFMYCDNLTTVSLPNTVKDISSNAFEDCNNLKYNEYDNAIYLGNAENPYAALIKVKSTDITDCEINSNCKVIAEDAFKDCTGLTSITVPISVEGISCGAFSGCSSLESITLPFVGDRRHSFTDARQYPFGYIFGYGEYEGGVATSQYFYDKDNTSYVSTTYYIPSSLKSVTLTDCDYIQYGAFYECNNLTTITIPTSVTQIESSAMPGGKNLTIYCNLKAAPRGWDSNWNPYNRPVVWGNIDVVDANNVDEAGFAYRIIDGTNVEIIDYLGSETEIVIPGTIIKNGVEYTVIRIGDNAFNSYKDMTFVTIPNTVTCIGNKAFRNCSGLSSVSIPNSVTTIGSCTFENCSDLKSVDIPNSVTTIGNSTFCGCSKINSVVIPNKITSISNNLFKDCSSLATITIPNSVTSIGNSAFSGCKSLTSVTIPNSVTRIGEWAFCYCGLTYIAVPNSVTRIDGWAFKGCDNLMVAVIPNSIETMDWLVFTECPNLTIYCETASEPEGWAEYWNDDNCPVVWDAGSNLRLFIAKGAANNVGFGKVDGGGAVVSGFTTKFSANPAEGYHFISWSDGNTDNPRTLTVTSDTVLTALFEAHTIVVDVAVPATRTETGLTEGSHCSVCGKVIVAQEIIPMLNATAVTETAANAVNIYAHGNTIVVENATDEISVYDAMGRLVSLAGRDVARNVFATEIRVNGVGVYIVKVGTVAKRVVVND